jgi:hypothetical protein
MKDVRIINASPADVSLDIWAGDSAAFKGVAFKQATPYREIPDNLFDFQIKSASSAEPLAQNRENLHDGEHYTIVAHNGAGQTAPTSSSKAESPTRSCWPGSPRSWT